MMGRACGIYGGREKYKQIWVEEWNLKKREHVEELYIVRMTIFKLSSKKRDKERVLD
jgi:hypothetical protein